MATTFVILQIQIKQVKKTVKWQMIAGMDKEELVLLKLSEKEKETQLHWEHAKEFEYKGEMYDIVESNTIGDTTYYWVWWDHQETKLNRKLNKLVSYSLRNNPNNQENQKQLHHFFKSLYFLEEVKKESIFFITDNKNYHFKQKFYHLISHAPLVPPPKKLKTHS